MTRDDLLEKLRALRDLFIRERVRSAVLFGSRARGDNRDDSDVDLLVEWETDAPVSLLGRARLQYLLEDALRQEVQVTKAPVRRAGLKSEIEKDGVLVF